MVGSTKLAHQVRGREVKHTIFGNKFTGKLPHGRSKWAKRRLSDKKDMTTVADRQIESPQLIDQSN